MAEILKGAPVAEKLTNDTRERAERLKAAGIIPTLAILRVGENESDLSYERGAVKRCAAAGIEVKLTSLPADVTEEEFFAVLDGLNKDKSIHGILMFRPLPKHINKEKARRMLAYEKDVDGCTDMSLSGVFTNTPLGFTPCTAEAAVEILKYYGIPISGKKVAVMGRSLVIGRPAAMLLMHENATVTVCHTKTVNEAEIARNSDIVIFAVGRPEKFGRDYFSPGQTVIDVGINWSETKGKIVGDVKRDECESTVGAYTPVPGGVGAVTTAVLVKHVVEAAERQNIK